VNEPPSDVYDVAIVGLGPVGAAAANLLGQRGIRCFACDRATDIFPLPRALGFDHETMRLLQACGLAADVEPYVRIYPRTEYRGVDGRAISRLEWVPEPFPLGWAPNYTFNQPEFERILRDGIGRYPSVDVALGVEVTAVDQGDDGVELAVVDAATASTRQVHAEYVIAADGGASALRRRLGVAMESLDFDEPWLVVDVICDDQAAASLPDCVIQYCEPDRPTTYVLGPGNHRRWELMLLPGEDPVEIATEDRVWELLARWVTPEHATLWRYTTYVFHALIATTWRDGRIFLAGDAAHMTPPFMAQGMVQGLRDVLTLTWKLDLVLDGAPASILDTYETERKPHVRATSEAAKALGAVICELDAEQARARDARLRAEFGDPPAVRLRQNLIPGLTGGILDLRCAVAGQVFPQPTVDTVGGRCRLDDVTGGAFRLIARAALVDIAAADATVGDALECLHGHLVAVASTRPDTDTDTDGEAGGRFVTVVDPIGSLDAWFDSDGCSAVLVRPDHYVYGTAVDLDSVRELCQLAAADLGLAAPPPQDVTELRC